MKQKYTSAGTSINSTKLPAIYSKIDVTKLGKVLDYGCGKFFDTYHLPSNVHGYDPFNRNVPEELGIEYDVVLCSNVLNVIAEEQIRMELLETMKRLGKTVLITVYEGNRTSIGKVTKADCYQLNRPLKGYIDEVKKVFGESVRIKNGMIVATAK